VPCSAQPCGCVDLLSASVEIATRCHSLSLQIERFLGTGASLHGAVRLRSQAPSVVFGDSRRKAVLWITYLFFSLAVLSCALMSAACAGVVANRGLSRSMFNASAIMSVVYTALSLVTGQLIG